MPYNVEAEFLSSLNSPHTRKSYESDIKHFFSYCEIKDYPLDVTLITREHALSFKNALGELGGRDGEPCAPYTIGRKLSALKSYFTFLVQYRGLTANPFHHVNPPSRVVKNERRVLEIAEIEDMIYQTESSKSGPLHAALIALNFYAILRLSEFINAKLEDYFEEDGLYYLRVRAKGHKFLKKEVPTPASERINIYLEWMRDNKRDMGPKNYLFRPTRNNHQKGDNLDKPLNPRTINRLLKKYALAAGINKNISSHSGRASAITNYLNLSEERNEVADIYGAKIMAGHSKISTTEIYDKKRRDDQQHGKLTDLYKKVS